MKIAFADVFLWIGTLKFMPYKADSITLFSWTYRFRPVAHSTITVTLNFQGERPVFDWPAFRCAPSSSAQSGGNLARFRVSFCITLPPYEIRPQRLSFENSRWIQSSAMCEAQPHSRVVVGTRSSSRA